MKTYAFSIVLFLGGCILPQISNADVSNVDDAYALMIFGRSDDPSVCPRNTCWKAGSGAKCTGGQYQSKACGEKNVTVDGVSGTFVACADESQNAEMQTTAPSPDDTTATETGKAGGLVNVDCEVTKTSPCKTKTTNKEVTLSDGVTKVKKDVPDGCSYGGTMTYGNRNSGSPASAKCS